MVIGKFQARRGEIQLVLAGRANGVFPTYVGKTDWTMVHNGRYPMDRTSTIRI